MTIKRYKKILVTGSAGFMGSHLYDYIFNMGYKVYGVDDLSGGFLRNISQKRFFTNLDLRNRKKTAAYIKKLKPDLVFHLAADATEGRSQFTPLSALDRNLSAYMNLLVPSIEHGLKKIVLISSMSVYGKQQVPFHEKLNPQPEDIYGISKAAMEKVTKVLANVHGFRYVIIRPHNCYGPRQNLSDPYRNVIGIFINRLMQGKNFYIYGDGRQKRAFSYIGNVIPVMAKSAFSRKCEDQIINVGSDTPVTLRQLSNIILNEFFGTNKIPTKFKPTNLPDRPREVKYAYCSHSVAKRLMGYRKQTDLSTGIRNMIRWAKLLGPQKFLYLEGLELDSPNVPQTWKKKLI